MKNPFRLELSTGIDIDASAVEVWNVLVGFERYPEWTGIFAFTIGHTRPGDRLKVRISSGGSRYATFEPVLLEARKPAEFRWKGRLLLRGIFDGEHIFKIDERDGGGVHFTHAELFGGFLVPWLRRELDTNTRRGFERFNRDIKTRSEETARRGRPRQA
ncbi:MAG TPA: SRPBCC domain-containing protein [Candidatus Eisenbacteria bacterium]|uniref:SRPBCC domain-containing protein n=1 Tax=Eiseniibacteriota bacterium TaxID=2212470 RepID=A0A7V2AU32_UNCEI|nr:SRPBCC domain-containing protein [Candidatus Eisenbacteria bacterium]